MIPYGIYNLHYTRLWKLKPKHSSWNLFSLPDTFQSDFDILNFYRTALRRRIICLSVCLFAHFSAYIQLYRIPRLHRVNIFLTILTKKTVLLNSVQGFIEIEVWLLLTFFYVYTINLFLYILLLHVKEYRCLKNVSWNDSSNR